MATRTAATQLDRVRSRCGDELTRELFHRVCRENREAAALLADSRLSFPSLYMLRPEIAKLELTGALHPENRRALEIAEGLTARQYEARPGDPEVLRRMLKTGYAEPDAGDAYDQIMDYTAILLVTRYRDRGVLPELEEMIFARNRRGAYTYDAQWAFFESGDPACLARTADRLRSPDARDVALARRMLAFIPGAGDAVEPAALRRHVMAWLTENGPYLRGTGRHNQSGGAPVRFAVSLPHQYLHRPLSAGEALPEDRQAALRAFAGLNEDYQRLLSRCSLRLHRQNPARWRRWMGAPLNEQIRWALRLEKEGSRP